MTTFSKIIFFMGLALVLSAGVVIGRLWGQRTELAAPADGQRNWLVDQLALTPEQKLNMDAIWADTRQKMGKGMEDRRNIDRQRDQAIQDLLSANQKLQFANIMDDFHNRRAEMDKTREVLVEEAEERSRGLLDDVQKKKWDTLSQEWRQRRQATTRRATSGPTKEFGGMTPGFGPRGFEHRPTSATTRPGGGA